MMYKKRHVSRLFAKVCSSVGGGDVNFISRVASAVMRGFQLDILVVYFCEYRIDFTSSVVVIIILFIHRYVY